MTIHTLAQTAYAASAPSIRTERGTERDVFARTTKELRQTDRHKDFPRFVSAIHRNRELWTLLAVNVADDQNGLPIQLRAQIFYLAEFTRKHSTEILTGTGDAAVLIDINTAIMHGLRESGSRK